MQSNHGRIIEKDWQLISYFENIRDLAIVLKHPWFGKYAHFYGRNQETAWFRVLKLIFVKRLILRIPLNYYMCFNLNGLKVLER